MHGEEEELYGDSGYIGAEKRENAVVKNKNGRKIKYKINRKPSTMKKLSKSGQYAAKKAEHKNHRSEQRSNTFLQSLSDCLGIGKHDTEVCENRPPN